MKSEKAKQYLLKVVTPIAMMYPDCPGECDIKLIEAKRAIELAEVIAMAEGGVESADEDFAKYMRKHVRNANKLMVKFNTRKKK